MTNINVLTIFPNLYDAFLNETIIKKAIDKNKLNVNIINIRDYTENKHKKVDDYPYGGGEGMLLMVQPIDDAIIKNGLENTKMIYTSPKGKVINQNLLYNLTEQYKDITILVGRYEGVDQRVLDKYCFEELSIGDFILTGGDLVAQVLIDSMSRLLPGVLNNSESIKKDTFTQKLLEHPQYTRPEDYQGLKVPEVLLSGHHKKIQEWQNKKQIEETKKKRPDLYKKYIKGEEDEKNT